MADPIYLIQKGGKALKLQSKVYDSEEEFQDLLEKYPELLAGEQVDRSDPRKWLLIGREVGIADDVDAGARWSLDHLFVDQSGTATLVEVKRQGDPRLRREVVGQVLDYAANAQFWSSAYLADVFEATCRKKGLEPESVLGEFLDGNSASGNFWTMVQDKLRAGDMRLIFFADFVPKELQRVVEFLNEGMSKTEVLAIEVTRYQAEDYTTHVPRVIGQTAQAEGKRAGTKARTWNEPDFFSAAESLPASAREAIRQVYEGARRTKLEIRWGKGAVEGTFNVVLPPPCNRAMLTFTSAGRIWLNSVWMYGSPAAELARSRLTELAQAMDVPSQYSKQPALDAERWAPHVHTILALIEEVARVTFGEAA